jgi:hypothetical protein
MGSVFAEIIAAAADYEQSNRTHPNAAIAGSVRLCRRAERGHLLTGAVPWQTACQPRIFGDMFDWVSWRFANLLTLSERISSQAPLGSLP